MAAGGVLGLLALAAWALHRRGWLRLRFAAGQRSFPLEAQERLMLGAQHTLHLVRAGDKGLLLAVYPGGCTLLESRPWPEWAQFSLEDRT